MAPYLLGARRKRVLAPRQHPARGRGHGRAALGGRRRGAPGAARVQLRAAGLELVEAPQPHLPHAARAGDHREERGAGHGAAGTRSQGTRVGGKVGASLWGPSQKARLSERPRARSQRPSAEGQAGLVARRAGKDAKTHPYPRFKLLKVYVSVWHGPGAVAGSALHSPASPAAQRQDAGGNVHGQGFRGEPRRRLLPLCFVLELLPDQLEEQGDLLLRQGLGDGERLAVRGSAHLSFRLHRRLRLDLPPCPVPRSSFFFIEVLPSGLPA